MAAYDVHSVFSDGVCTSIRSGETGIGTSKNKQIYLVFQIFNKISVKLTQYVKIQPHFLYALKNLTIHFNFVQIS